MKGLMNCQLAEKILNSAASDGENLETHIAICSECQEARRVSDWMQNFAALSSKPQNLPAPGLLLFKSRLVEKQTAARRAVRPIFWMQIVSALIVGLAVVYLQAKNSTSISEIFRETFASLSSVAPMFALSLLGAALICYGFAYSLRPKRKRLNNADR
jgi:hypothetical protein